MILHLLKLVWHRKRVNALVMTEIFFSFLVVFAVVTMTVAMVTRWRAPLGFSWQNVWTVNVINVAPDADGKTEPADAATDRLMRELRAMPQIEAVGADAMAAYSTSEWTSTVGDDSHRTDTTVDLATDDYAKVMKLNVLRGRWFQREDDADNFMPEVLDRDAALAIFGTIDNVVGKKLPRRENGEKEDDRRVVGIIAPYRKSGELSGVTRMVFRRKSFSVPPHALEVSGHMSEAPDVRTIVVAVRPGTSPDFEAKLSDHLHAVAPDVTVRIRRMEQMRRLMLRLRVTPLAVLSVIALFLITMVGLGLTGVLWQTVTRRMREIGLRRALGATGHGVRSQVLTEVALLATLAVLAGLVIILQLPLLGVMHFVTTTELTSGLAGALAVIYGITLLCGAYPSWLASRIEPAEALRYE